MSSITTSKLGPFADKNMPDNLSKLLVGSKVLLLGCLSSTSKQPLAAAGHRSNILPNNKHTKAGNRTPSPKPTIKRIIKRTRTPSPAPKPKRHKKVATQPRTPPPPSEPDSTSGSEEEIPLPRSFYSRPHAGGKLLHMGGIPKTRKKLRQTSSPPSTYASSAKPPSSTSDFAQQTPSHPARSASKPTTMPRTETTCTRKALDAAVLAQSYTTRNKWEGDFEVDGGVSLRGGRR